ATTPPLSSGPIPQSSRPTAFGRKQSGSSRSRCKSETSADLPASAPPAISAAMTCVAPDAALAARRFKATLVGGIAVLLWALLALFATGAAGIPPFQLLAMAFAVAFLVSLVVLAARGRRAFAAWRQAPAVWALGVGGLFGYHFFYFVALGNAPAV